VAARPTGLTATVVDTEGNAKGKMILAKEAFGVKINRRRFHPKDLPPEGYGKGASRQYPGAHFCGRRYRVRPSDTFVSHGVPCADEAQSACQCSYQSI
jgi:hypothetical protein